MSSAGADHWCRSRAAADDREVTGVTLTLGTVWSAVESTRWRGEEFKMSRFFSSGMFPPIPFFKLLPPSSTMCSVPLLWTGFEDNEICLAEAFSRSVSSCILPLGSESENNDWSICWSICPGDKALTYASIWSPKSPISWRSWSLWTDVAASALLRHVCFAAVQTNCTHSRTQCSLFPNLATAYGAHHWMNEN